MSYINFSLQLLYSIFKDYFYVGKFENWGLTQNEQKVPSKEGGQVEKSEVGTLFHLNKPTIQ